MKTAPPESPSGHNLGPQETKTDTLISNFRVKHKWNGWTAFLTLPRKDNQKQKHHGHVIIRGPPHRPQQGKGT